MHNVKTIAAILLIPAYSVVSIASPAIGVATGFQDLTVNKAHVQGNTTLFEGSSFATGPDGARMSLNGGTSVRLGSLSTGIIYRDRMELRSGAGEFHSAGTYRIDALSLHVRNAGQGSVARVLVSGNHLRVGALAGNLQVLNGQGLLLATVAEGTATEFTPAAAPAASDGGAGAAGASASGAGASGAAGAGAAGGVAGTAAAGAAGGVLAGHMALVIAGVVVAGAGLATGVAVAATSGSAATLSPSAR
jgi:hypothetical protein